MSRYSHSSPLEHEQCSLNLDFLFPACEARQWAQIMKNSQEEFPLLCCLLTRSALANILDTKLVPDRPFPTISKLLRGESLVWCEVASETKYFERKGLKLGIRTLKYEKLTTKTVKKLMLANKRKSNCLRMIELRSRQRAKSYECHLCSNLVNCESDVNNPKSANLCHSNCWQKTN